ncbi:MAG: hypothetical protein JW703_01690 [Candidatus Diapherotrites archaeon]|nr:hypothetical protein [Candidatus Diapherotrites archaeon]
MNGIDFSEKLKKLDFEIVFTNHAELRIIQRQLEKQKIISDLKNPVSLKLIEKQECVEFEEKYKLWFIPFKRTAYIYVIVINYVKKKIFVKTVIKQRLIWQKKVEKNVV